MFASFVFAHIMTANDVETGKQSVAKVAEVQSQKSLFQEWSHFRRDHKFEASIVTTFMMILMAKICLDIILEVMMIRESVVYTRKA